MTQIEKLKAQKANLPTEKKNEKTKKSSKTDKSKKDKVLKEKEKKCKDQIASLKKRVEEIGTQLLMDLVNLMSRKGMLNSLVKTMNGYEACRPGRGRSLISCQSLFCFQIQPQSHHCFRDSQSIQELPKLSCVRDQSIYFQL